MSLSSTPNPPSPFHAADHLAALIESAEDAIIGKRLDGTVVSWNPAATALFGYTAAQAVGQPVTLLIPAERLHEEVDILARIGRGQRVQHFETQRRCADGSLVDVSISISPIRDVSGQIVGASKIVRDLRHLLAARAQARQYQDLVQTALEAIIAIDGAHRICLFNPAAEEMFGRTAASVMGQSVELLIPEGARATHHQHVAGFAAEGASPRRMGFGARSLHALRADGSIFPVEAAVSRFGQGEQLRMTVVLRDVTAQHRAAALRNAAAMAQAANEAKSVFIARMTHELRTPLNAVLGFAHLMLLPEGGVSEPRQRTHAQHIHSAGRHLLSLIDDLLDLARIEAGRMRVASRPVDLAALVADAQAVLDPIARSSRVSLHHKVPAGLFCVADPVRLRQVLFNLLSNAIKFNRPGGEVRLRASEQGDRVELCVEDNGAGMTPEALAQLFQPFNRLGQDGRGVPGTGLGLVVVQQLVAMMKGSLQVQSQVGQGTTACLTLPLCPEGAAPQADAALAGAADVEPEQTLRGSVLCLEDHPVNRLLVEAVLSAHPGVQLAFAADGQTGLKLVQSLQPDLVLLDLHLPDMHGLDWLTQVRADPALAHTTVALLSASLQATDLADAKALGVVGSLAKPLDVGPFLQSMAQWLAQAQLRR